MRTKGEILVKLTSTKLLSLIGVFAFNIMVVMNMNESEITEVVAIITSFGAVVTYIVANVYQKKVLKGTEETGGDEDVRSSDEGKGEV